VLEVISVCKNSLCGSCAYSSDRNLICHNLRVELKTKHFSNNDKYKPRLPCAFTRLDIELLLTGEIND